VEVAVADVSSFRSVLGEAAMGRRAEGGRRGPAGGDTVNVTKTWKLGQDHRPRVRCLEKCLCVRHG
jgi:hypothetical protein